MLDELPSLKESVRCVSGEIEPEGSSCYVKSLLSLHGHVACSCQSASELATVESRTVCISYGELQHSSARKLNEISYSQSFTTTREITSWKQAALGFVKPVCRAGFLKWQHPHN
jgi:hypothetical protein